MYIHIYIYIFIYIDIDMDCHKPHQHGVDDLPEDQIFDGPL